MKSVTYLLSLVILTSCSSKSIVTDSNIKSVKVTSKEERSTVFYRDYDYKDIKRSIASVDALEDRLSDKNTYFLSLYSQYKSLNKLTNQENKLNVCPQFHNEILSAGIKVHKLSKVDSKNFKSYMKNPYAVVSNPSLSLNYEGQNVYTYLSRKNMWNKAHSVIENALINHNKLNLSELNQLCETGGSEGFHAYKNMVSFYSSNSFARSRESMPAFLKIPVLANMLILNNYTRSLSSYEKGLISSLNISWFSNYLYDLKKDSETEYLTKVSNE